MYNITKIYKNCVNSWLILTWLERLHSLHHRKLLILEKGYGNGVNILMCYSAHQLKIYSSTCFTCVKLSQKLTEGIYDNLKKKMELYYL